MAQETRKQGRDAPAQAHQEAEARRTAADQQISADDKPTVFIVVCVLLMYVAIGLVVAWSSPAGKMFLAVWWWAIALALLLLLGILAFPPIRERLKAATPRRRVGLTIFVVVPLLLLAVGLVFLLPVFHQGAAFRALFCLMACMFPATLYYLFMVTRRHSLLNEFVITLERLGLLEPRRLPSHVAGATRWESEGSRQRRVQSYLQKFEAVYGPLPPEVVEGIVATADAPPPTSDRPGSRLRITGMVNIFPPETMPPVFVATVLIALGWLVTLPPWQPWQPPPPPGTYLLLAQFWQEMLTPQQTPVHFAFLGAYFFAVQMLFRRYVRRDLRGSAYVAVALRIVLAVIGTWVAVSAVQFFFTAITQDRLLVLGFAIGVFPRVAWQVVQAATKKLTGLALLLPSLHAELPISDLDGLTVWHEARLEEEDIENIPNMATADVVELMLHTRFHPDRIIEWVDQAILYMHLGPEPRGELSRSRRHLLRTHGIMNATALIEAYRQSAVHQDRAAFETLLPGAGRSVIRALIDTMVTNPNLALIRTWRGLEPMPASGMGTPAAEERSAEEIRASTGVDI